MNGRERVLAAIAHRSPDYVPLDLGATPSSGISAIAYNNLKKHLGMTGGHTRIFDVVQQVVIPEEEIIDRFGVDIPIFEKSEQTFCTQVEVTISDAFFAWLFKFGKQAVILDPPEAAERMKKILAETQQQYLNL